MSQPPEERRSGASNMTGEIDLRQKQGTCPPECHIPPRDVALPAKRAS